MSDDIDQFLDNDTQDVNMHPAIQMQMFAGMAPGERPRPAFTLVKLGPRKREVNIAVKGEAGFTFEKQIIDEDGGYMLRALKGHSVFIPNLDELRKRGLSEYVPMLVGEDGNVAMTVPIAAVTATKQKAA